MENTSELNWKHKLARIPCRYFLSQPLENIFWEVSLFQPLQSISVFNFYFKTNIEHNLICRWNMTWHWYDLIWRWSDPWRSREWESCPLLLKFIEGECQYLSTGSRLFALEHIISLKIEFSWSIDQHLNDGIFFIQENKQTLNMSLLAGANTSIHANQTNHIKK